ncbi:hypothetical protein [Vibrio sp. 10N.222.55.B11]|uniref:hypothetical protein n=1 Tax=Vibrio sp. 10N.222.55.B11 TaxID=3229648 RepID=UPI00354B7CC3
MTLSTSLASVCLVLLGLLFGFNIQISASFNSFLTSIGTVLSGLGAAFAAFYSYKSSLQWKSEFNHSTLYEYLNELERLLIKFTSNISENLNDESLDVMTAFRAPTNSSSEVREQYQLVYARIEELIDEEQLVHLEQLNLSKLTFSLTQPFIDYTIKRKALFQYLQDNEDRLESADYDDPLVQKYVSSIDEKMEQALQYHLYIEKICSEAKSSLKMIRKSLSH